MNEEEKEMEIKQYTSKKKKHWKCRLGFHHWERDINGRLRRKDPRFGMDRRICHRCGLIEELNEHDWIWEKVDYTIEEK